VVTLDRVRGMQCRNSIRMDNKGCQDGMGRLGTRLGVMRDGRIRGWSWSSVCFISGLGSGL
jgi:hypothetical protein